MTDVRFLVTCATALILWGAATRADEAVLRDGQSVTGALTADGQGGLHFAAGGKVVPSSQIARVRLGGAPAPFRAGNLFHALLHSGECLTGELLGLDGHSLRLRTAWKDEVRIPRHALAAVTHFTDQVPLFEEDFEKDLTGWQLSGAPARSDRQHGSGGYSLCLDTPGQEAAYALSRPLESGRVEVNFLDPGPAAGTRWLLVAEFAGAKEPVRAVLVDATEHYSLETPLAAEDVAPVPRERGWRRLSLRFAPAYLLAGVDDAVVWSSAKAGPGGPLRKISLRCEATSDEKATPTAVYFDDLTVARPADGVARRTGDRGRDDVWLLAGDQLFGRVTRADRRTLDLEARPGKQTLSWAEIRGVYFAPPDEARRTVPGARVRIGIRPGRGSGLDELEGVLHALDDGRLVLRHTDLGELAIDRAHVAQVRPLMLGQPQKPAPPRTVGP